MVTTGRANPPRPRHLRGDTVNRASRMESLGVPGRVQVTESVLHRLRDRYLFERRGSIDVKGKGEMVTYFLLGRGERTDESTVVKEDKTSPAE